MLPFFFRHYDEFVQRYIIYADLDSTDETLDILRAHPRVEIRPVSVSGDAQSLHQAGAALIKDCWKESRTTADWVIMTDIDEHVYHPDLPGYLANCKKNGITIIPALGFQMLSKSFPSSDTHLSQQLTMGAPWSQMSKLNVFSPADIDEINYTPGRHTANPEGNVVLPDSDELLLLHYKYIGFEYTHGRHEQSSQRLREMDIAHGWGHKWRWTREQLREDWDRFANQLVDISTLHQNLPVRHAAPRWWRSSQNRETQA